MCFGRNISFGSRTKMKKEVQMLQKKVLLFFYSERESSIWKDLSETKTPLTKYGTQDISQLFVINSVLLTWNIVSHWLEDLSNFAKSNVANLRVYCEREKESVIKWEKWSSLSQEGESSLSPGRNVKLLFCFCRLVFLLTFVYVFESFRLSAFKCVCVW